MALSLAQKTQVRLHLGYPVAGLARISPAGGSLASGAVSWRFTEAYGFLEYRMNNLSAEEEVRITGAAYGAIGFVGVSPQPGDTATVIITGGELASPQTVSATVVADTGVDPALQLVLGLAAAVASNPVCRTAGFIAVSPYGTGAFSENLVPFPEVGFVGSTQFIMVASGTGQAVPQVILQGGFIDDPQTSLDGVNTLTGYLPILAGLKGQLYASSQNQDTLQAGPWRAKGSEIAHRTSLYLRARADLSDFLGIPINPRRLNNWKNNGAMRYL